jgi:hypothetical protein
MNTELNTPRTDAQAGWAIANQYGQSTARELLGDPDGVFVHAVFARTLERELAAERDKAERYRLATLKQDAKLAEVNAKLCVQQRTITGMTLIRSGIERELATEREKVRVLRLACDQICEEWGRNHDANPIGAGQRMSTLAGKVLEKLEE